MDDPTAIRDNANALPWHKWRLVLWFWLAQAAFITLFVPFWILQGESVDGQKGQRLGTLRWERVADLFTNLDVWGVILGAIAALMALQTILVWPVRKPRARNDRGWPLRLSIGVAALLGTSLGVTLLFGFYTIIELQEQHWSADLNHIFAVVFWGWIALSYIGGGLLMYAFCIRRLKRGERHEDILGRIAATLFIGTLVEVAAIMPIDIMFRRKQDCYCFAGTFWAYILLLAAGLVTLGPAVLLPVLTRRRKRWYASHCDCCGYDMTGIIHADRAIDRCPECGAGWKPDVPFAPHPNQPADQMP